VQKENEKLIIVFDRKKRRREAMKQEKLRTYNWNTYVLWHILYHEMKQMNSTRVQRYSFHLNDMQWNNLSTFTNTIFTDIYKYLFLVYYN
jgi:hypothetical protein